MNTLTVQPSRSPLDGEVIVPGDKSISHRAVMFGALAGGRVRVTGLGDGADNKGTARAFRQLGVAIAPDAGALAIDGVGLRGLRAPAGALDCGNSGTTIRLLVGLLGAQPFEVVMTGDESLRRRPMRRVTDPVSRMGARFEGAAGAKPGELYPPLRSLGAAGGVHGIDYTLPVASAQIKSAVLLAAMYGDGPTAVREPGPSRDHTERMLRYLGCPVRAGADAGPGVTVLDPTGWDGALAARPIAVPGDPSSAAFLVVAALVAGARRVVVRGVCVNDTRTGFLDVLAAMGARVALEARDDSGAEPVADLVVEGAAAGLRAVEVAGDVVVRAIDELPILAVAAARADGVTWFRDAAELRVKESDRIATTAAMLRAFGVEVEERPDAFAVHGVPDRPLAAGEVDAAGDHRIAMAGAVAALVADAPSRITDAANVATSFPGFVRAMNELGAILESY